jgi:uncharacterized protein
MIMRRDIQEIKKIAMETFVMDKDSIHGVHHWNEVYENGMMLALQPGVDKLVVGLFAYLHDCKREDDHQDPEHGDRAADFVVWLRNSGKLEFITHEQYHKLWLACMQHHKGIVETEDITIGACFDADRIELIRCGMVPKVELMNTEMGIRIAQKMNDLQTFKGH